MHYEIEPSIERLDQDGEWESVAGPFKSYEEAGEALERISSNGVTHPDGSAISYRIWPAKPDC